MRIFTLALVLFGMAIGTTDAAETPDTATVKAVIKVFRKRFAEESMRVRMEALRELAETRHFLAVDEIGRRVLTDEDPEVRMAGALILARVGANPDRAGPFLRDLLAKNDDHPEVQVEFIRAIRKLDYRGAHRELVKAAMRFLEEDYRFVTAEVLMTFGAQKELSSLPFMLKLAEYNTEKLRGRRGPAIRTGSSESTASRRAKWMKLYGKFMMPKGDPGIITKWWLCDLVNAVKAITGEEFRDHFAFRSWLLMNRRELKIKLSDLDRKRKLKPPKPKPCPEHCDCD